jgi:hypothetical protein
MKVIILYIKNEFTKKPFHDRLNNSGHKGLTVIILCNQIQKKSKNIYIFCLKCLIWQIKPTMKTKSPWKDN